MVRVRPHARYAVKLKSAIAAIIALVILAPSASFAADGGPIPGLDVKLGKNPGGIVAHSTTNKLGEFAFDKPVVAGEYVLTISWDDAVRLAPKNASGAKSKAASVITVNYEIVERGGKAGLPAGRRMHKPFVITKELDKSTPLAVFTLPAGATVSGSLVVD